MDAGRTAVEVEVFPAQAEEFALAESGAQGEFVQRVHGVFTLLPMLTGKGREHHGEILREAAALADSGLLKPLLDPRRYTLDTVAQAHTAVEDGSAHAKIVVDIEA